MLLVICTRCHEQESVGTQFYCRPCRQEYDRARYRRLRAEWVEQLGGRCVDCGATENLQFDHIDASTKVFEIGATGWTRPKAQIQAELAKCALRCQPCHLKKSLREGDMRSVEHGGGVAGKKGCKCPLCKAKKAEYMKRYSSQK